jgi:hypothetical protein
MIWVNKLMNKPCGRNSNLTLRGREPKMYNQYVVMISRVSRVVQLPSLTLTEGTGNLYNAGSTWPDIATCTVSGSKRLPKDDGRDRQYDSVIRPPGWPETELA